MNGTTVLPVLMQLHESASDLRYYTSRYLGLIGPDAKRAISPRDSKLFRDSAQINLTIT